MCIANFGLKRLKLVISNSEAMHNPNNAPSCQIKLIFFGDKFCQSSWHFFLLICNNILSSLYKSREIICHKYIKNCKKKINTRTILKWFLSTWTNTNNGRHIWKFNNQLVVFPTCGVSLLKQKPVKMSSPGILRD